LRNEPFLAAGVCGELLVRSGARFVVNTDGGAVLATMAANDRLENDGTVGGSDDAAIAGTATKVKNAVITPTRATQVKPLIWVIEMSFL